MSVYKSPYFGTGQELDEALLKVKNSDAEAWATGQRNGVDVTPTDETYQNNAKYYAEKLAREPLIGTTDELTPAQVYDAVSAGIPVKVQYLDETSGLLSYTNFNVVENMHAIAANTIVYYNGSYRLGELIGDTDINEWSFISTTLAQKTDIPTALPNPNALTFTGAVTGSYNGSEALTVEIPSGGGGEKAWRLLNTATIKEEVSSISINQDSDGNPFEIEDFLIYAPLDVVCSAADQLIIDAVEPGAEPNNAGVYPWVRISSSLNNFLGTTKKSIVIKSTWAGMRYTEGTGASYDIANVAVAPSFIRVSSYMPTIGGIKLIAASVSNVFTAGTFYIFGR